MSDAAPTREWRFYIEDMVAFCDKVLVYHGYLGIDDDTLWSIVSDDVVPLRAALIRLLDSRPD